MKMLTVEDINRTFSEKGVHVKLPLPSHCPVKNMQILERKRTPGGISLLLSIRFINDQGQEISDLFHCEGEVEREETKTEKPFDSKLLLLDKLLPLRSREGFDTEDEALDYLKESISHLLQDKGYIPVDRGLADLCFENRESGFFVNLALRCDDLALERAKELVTIRQEHGVDHEYGLVIPAFQEALGVPLLLQDRWMLRNQEYLSANRIGVYGVDNWNPNLVYAFTIHPGSRELRRYFMTTGPKWTLVRSRYVLSRKKRAAEGRNPDE